MTPAPAIDTTRADLQALDRSFARAALSLDGSVLRVNGIFLRLFGYKSREIVGGSHAIFLTPQDAAREEEAAFWTALRSGEIQTGDYRRLRKDGAEIWLQATYTPIVDATGAIVEIIVLATDVTARLLRTADERGQISAINASHAVIHFAPDGTILDANAAFLATMGYDLAEVRGRHHSMFVDASEADDAASATFWTALAEGRHHAGQYKRLGKDGRNVWLQATYNPILDMSGRPFKIVKYAVDVTQERLRQADQEGQIAAIHTSQAVITFNMDGTVIEANHTFLEAMGYRLDEIEGRHHRMFVDPSYAHGPEYATFWDELSLGHHQAGEYKRLGRDGREVWLQATYNPVFDLSGRPLKVVKYATMVTREKLRQADLQGQIASIHKAQCVISFDVDGKILDANDNFLAATGYRLTELRGRHHRMFVDDSTGSSSEYDEFWKDLASGRHQAGEFRRLRKDGREIWLQATYNPILDMSGRPFKVVKYATDITQERLRQADYEGQVAAIRKSQCVVAFDLDGILLDANETFLEAMGYRLEEVAGRHHRLFVETDFAETEAYAAFWETLRSGAFLSARFKRVGKGGRDVWIQASYNPILDLNGRPFKVIKIATDVTADVALAADLSHARRQALHDATTALPNRLALSSFLESALARPEARLAVLYLDLDHFKPINDTFGHQVGDQVLCETAARLRRALRPDQMAARIGGDEFVVAAPDLSNAEIEALCRSLIAAVTAPIRYDKGTVSVGLSIGVAVSPKDAATPDDLLRCADLALYRSKGNGRGSYSFFAIDTHDRIDADRHLADDMLHSIKAGQFFLEYQPRFDARSHEVRSVEALVRWDHPERGRIEPADFIPLAEKSGLIVPLGEWVLRMAARAAVSGWLGIGLSVTVSPVQLRSADLLEMVSDVLMETGLEPGRLELDITGDALLEDEARGHAVLDALQALGVRVAIDGFGASAFSLDHLRHFAFDAIKIDRRFIADLEEHDGGQAVVQTILAVGRSLGMSVSAAGVETTGQLLLLSLGNCSEVQGFLLAKPMPAAEISALLAREAASRACPAARESEIRPLSTARLSAPPISGVDAERATRHSVAKRSG